MLIIPFLRHKAQTASSPQADRGQRPRRQHGLRILALFLACTLGLSLIQPALAALVWQIQIVDSAGKVGLYTALALDSSGNPVISYYEPTNGALKLVHCGNATCSSANTIRTVDSAGVVGQYNSLALDSSGNPVISYFDLTNRALKLVHCGDATCSSANTIRTVDSAGVVGLSNSLALDSSGNPVISYYDFGNDDLKLVHCGNATCSSANTIRTVDSAGSVGSDTSLALDSSGNPVISYYDDTNQDLKLVHCGDATCSSGNTIVTVDSAGSVGSDTSLALDSSGNPVISYYDFGNDDLKLVHCGDATCSSNTIRTVDSAGDVGRFTALALDSSGDPVISYYDSSNSALKLVHCGDATCSSDNTIRTVDSAGEVGEFTALALDSSGHPVISYYGSTNGDLKLARLVDDPPPSVTVNQAAGQVDPANTNPVLFSASFSENVTGFTSADVTLNGTANLASANITVSGGPRDYTISVSGVAGNGTVIATIAAGVASNAAGKLNTASTSTDNSVTFDSIQPVITPTVVGTLGNNGWYVSDVTVSFTCADEAGGSGIATNTVAGVTVSSEGAGQSVTNTGQCNDNTGNAALPVTVNGLNLDKTPPTLNPVVSPNPVLLGAAASVTSEATDGVSGIASESCGVLDTSSVGSQSVICTATDNASNTTNATVDYTVLAPPTLLQQVQVVRSSLVALLPSGDSKTDKSLQKAIAKIDQALAANLWQPDGNHLTLIGDDVFNRLRDAVQELTKLKNPSTGSGQAPPPTVGAAITSLTTISRTLAQIALDEASSGGGNASKIAKAQSKLSKGDAEAAKGKAANAIAQYEDAWEYAQQSLGYPVAASLDADELLLDDASDPSASDAEAAEPVEEAIAEQTSRLFLPLINR